MDPEKTLADLRELSQAIVNEHDNPADDLGSLSMDQYITIAGLASDLAESVQAIDAWLSRGGFLPKLWTRES